MDKQQRLLATERWKHIASSNTILNHHCRCSCNTCINNWYNYYNHIGRSKYWHTYEWIVSGSSRLRHKERNISCNPALSFARSTFLDQPVDKSKCRFYKFHSLITDPLESRYQPCCYYKLHASCPSISASHNPSMHSWIHRNFWK